MRKRAIWIACGWIGLLLMITMSGVAFGAANLEAYRAVAETPWLVLYVNDETTAIAVQHKPSGHVWLSNPSTAAAQQHQLAISYWDPEDKVREMNTQRDAVAHGQYEIVPIDAGIMVRYVLGQEWANDAFIPQMVSQTRFEQFLLPRLPADADRQFMNNQFILVDLVDLHAPEADEALKALNANEKILDRFVLVSPNQTLSSSDRRTLSTHLLNVISTFREDIPDSRSVQASHLERFVNNPTYIIHNRLRPWDRTSMIDLLRASGYTPLDVQVDHRENGLDEPVQNVETFTLALEYRLDGDALVVRIPMDEIQYPKDVIPQKTYVLRGTNISDRPYIRDNFDAIGGDQVTYPIRTLEVLKHFGAAPTHPDSYVFVPDGSGALIRLDKATGLAYSQRIFGRDWAQPPATGSASPPGLAFQNSIHREQLHFPVFGLKEEDRAFFAIVEQGAALGEIRVESATDRINSNAVFTTYNMTSAATVDLLSTARSQRGGNKSINIYSEGLPQSDIVLRYHFLTGDAANYVGMASLYRDYLFGEKGERSQTDPSDIPFYLELVGSIWKRSLVLGIPIVRTMALTDFEGVLTIVDELLDAGIGNVLLRYSGWQRGGLKGAAPTESAVEPALGTKDGWLELNAALEERGVGFYPDVASMNLHESAAKGVNLRRTAAQRANGQPLFTVEKAGLAVYAISPALLPSMQETFLNGFRPYRIDGLALRDLGRLVHADFQSERPIDREAALTIVRGQLERLRLDQGGLELMVDGANAYALPVASHVVNAPLGSSAHRIFSEAVPFYQMVLHGTVPYAGEPLNLTGDFRKHVLRSIETGSSPHFRWTHEPSSQVKETAFDDLYSTGYAEWIEQAIEAYREINGALRLVQGQRMVGHGQVAPNVFRTDYENGVSIVVNYNPDAVVVDGIEVDGLGHRLVVEGER